MTPGERFEKLRIEQDKSVSEAAIYIGVSNQAIYQFESGATKGMKPENLLEAARFIGLSVEELVTGERPAINQDRTAYISLRRVPVTGYAKGGADDGFFDEIDDGDGFIELPSVSSTAYAKRVRGMSMAPRIKDGEYIIADPGANVAAGDDVMVHTSAGQKMVKQYLFERKGECTFGSINSAHAQITLTRTEIGEMHAILAYLPRGTRLFKES